MELSGIDWQVWYFPPNQTETWRGLPAGDFRDADRCGMEKRSIPSSILVANNPQTACSTSEFNSQVILRIIHGKYCKHDTLEPFVYFSVFLSFLEISWSSSGVIRSLRDMKILGLSCII